MGTIFISYRREDSGGHAGRLFDALGNRFGSARVFRDIEDLEPGVDFVDALDKALNQCAALLVIIGPGWSTAAGSTGRRLDQPDDFVRMEVAKALERNVRVVPVLVAGATMPGTNELPENLHSLARRNAIELSDTRWDYDVGRLGDTLAKALEIPEDAAPGGLPAQDAASASPDASAAPGKKGAFGIKSLAALAAIIVLAVGVSMWFVPTEAPSPLPDTVDQDTIPSAAVPSSYWLQLRELKCENASGRTDSGNDEPYIEVDGVSVWGPETMRCPGNVSLERRPPIKLLAESYRIELRESDTAFGRVIDTDLLGFTEAPLEEGDRSHTFTEGGARYVLTWEVERR
jgi:hypothetical protein